MKTQISNSMMLALIINIVYAKAIGITQGILARQAGADMWIVTLFSIVIGLGIMLLTVVTIKRLPEKNIMEQTKIIIGPIGEKIVGLILFIFFTGAFTGSIITIVYHLKDYFLPEIPTIIFVLVIGGTAFYGIVKGIEVIARFAVLGLFSIIVLNVLLLFGSLSYFDITAFLPLFRNGIVHNVMLTKHPNSDWAMATLMIAIILPMVKQPEKWTKFSKRGLIMGGILVLMWPILQVGVLSPEVTGQYIVSCMQMARSAEIGLFVHRYELIMIIFFAISALVQLMMCLICATISFKHVIGDRNLNKLYIPITLAVGGFGYWIVENHLRAMDFLENIWPYISMPIIFGLPLAIFLLGFIFKRKLEKAREAIKMENEEEESTKETIEELEHEEKVEENDSEKEKNEGNIKGEEKKKEDR